MVINDFIEAMLNKDHKALAACFMPECRFVDYCPSMSRGENTFLYGPNAIEMFFHNQFVFGRFAMQDPRITSPHTVNFYAVYQGTTIHAVAQIENCNDGACDLDDSLIREMVIRPA